MAIFKCAGCGKSLGGAMTKCAACGHPVNVSVGDVAILFGSAAAILILGSTLSDSTRATVVGADLVVAFLVVGLGIYFYPTMTAGTRRHPHLAAVFVLNLFFGWTLLGWVAALVWALTAHGDLKAEAAEKRAATGSPDPHASVDDQRSVPPGRKGLQLLGVVFVVCVGSGLFGVAAISMMSPASTSTRHPLLTQAPDTVLEPAPQRESGVAAAGQVGLMPAPTYTDRTTPPRSGIPPSPVAAHDAMPSVSPATVVEPIVTRPSPLSPVADADVFRSPAALNCNATSSPAQKMVCTDVELAAQEVAVRRLFDAAQLAAYNRSPAEANALLATYAASSAERDACGDRACLTAWFASREAQLSGSPGQ